MASDAQLPHSCLSSCSVSFRLYNSVRFSTQHQLTQSQNSSGCTVCMRSNITLSIWFILCASLILPTMTISLLSLLDHISHQLLLSVVYSQVNIISRPIPLVSYQSNTKIIWHSSNTMTIRTMLPISLIQIFFPQEVIAIKVIIIIDTEQAS